MSKKSVGSMGSRTGKSFILALICLIMLLALIGALIRFTPLPERWASLYVLGALCVACLFIGVLMGNVIKKKGMLFGALFTVAFLLLILVISVLITGTYSEAGLMQVRFIPCIVFGSIGGMIGVNLRT